MTQILFHKALASLSFLIVVVGLLSCSNRNENTPTIYYVMGREKLPAVVDSMEPPPPPAPF